MTFRLCLNLGTLRHIDYPNQLDVSVQAGSRCWPPHGQLEDYLSKGIPWRMPNNVSRNITLTAVEMRFSSRLDLCQRERPRAIHGPGNGFYKTWLPSAGPLLVATTVCEGKHDDALARENFREICRLASEKKDFDCARISSGGLWSIRSRKRGTS